MVRTAASSRSVFSSQPRFSKEGDFKIDFKSSEDALTFRSSASHLPMTAQVCCVTILTTFRLSAQPGAEVRLTVVQAEVSPQNSPSPALRVGDGSSFPPLGETTSCPGEAKQNRGAAETPCPTGGYAHPPQPRVTLGPRCRLPLRARSLPGCPAR